MKKTVLLSILLMFGSQPIYSSDQSNNNFWGKAIGIVLGAFVAYKALSYYFDLKPVGSQLATPMSMKQSTGTNLANRGTLAHIAVLQQGAASMGETCCQGSFWKNIFENVEGTNCGYHALKNALIALNILDENNSKFNDPELYKFLARPWIEEIQQRNRASGQTHYPLGNMIGGADIDHLINKFQSDYKSFITVVDSFEIFEDPTKMLIQHLETLEKIAKNKSVNHVFIVNTDALQPAEMGRGCHWVAYAISKFKGALKIREMNSLSSISNPKIAEKIFELCSLTLQNLDQRRASLSTEQTKLAADGAAIDHNDKYTLQHHVALNCSLGLVDFQDLLLPRKLVSEQEQIKDAFEDCFASAIQDVRATKVVAIDGRIDQDMTAIRQAEIAERFPCKNYVFTCWKSSRTGKWHVEYDVPTSIEQFVAQRSKQYGVKGPNDKTLRFYN